MRKTLKARLTSELERSRTLRRCKSKDNCKRMLSANQTSSGKPWAQVLATNKNPKRVLRGGPKTLNTANLDSRRKASSLLEVSLNLRRPSMLETNLSSQSSEVLLYHHKKDLNLKLRPSQ